MLKTKIKTIFCLSVFFMFGGAVQAVANKSFPLDKEKLDTLYVLELIRLNLKPDSFTAMPETHKQKTEKPKRVPGNNTFQTKNENEASRESKTSNKGLVFKKENPYSSHKKDDATKESSFMGMIFKKEISYPPPKKKRKIIETSEKGLLFQKGYPYRFPKKDEEIQVRIKNGRLCDALKDLEEVSDIHYSCSRTMTNARIKRKISPGQVLRGKSGSSVIKKLLVGFDTVEIWNSDGELASVYLLGALPRALMGGLVSDQDITSKTTNKPSGKVRRRSAYKDLGTPGVRLTAEQMWTVINLSENEPLPDALYHHPGLAPIWKMAKITGPNDWMEPRKNERVKRHLEQLMKIKKKQFISKRKSRHRKSSR